MNFTKSLWITFQKRRLKKSISNLNSYLNFIQFQKDNDLFAEFKSTYNGGLQMSRYIPLNCFSKNNKSNKEKLSLGTGLSLAKENLLKNLLDLKTLSVFSKENLFSTNELSQLYFSLLNEVNESESNLNKSISNFVDKFEKNDIQQPLLSYYKENFDLTNFKKDYNNKLKQYKFHLNNFILKYSRYLKPQEFRTFEEIALIIEKRLEEKYIQIKQSKLDKQNKKTKYYEKAEEEKSSYDDYKSSSDDSSNSLLLSTVLMSAVG